MASPCIAAGVSLHQVILVRDVINVVAKLNHGLEQAEIEWAICLHQDVWLPAGWDLMLAQQIQAAELRFGPIGVAGVYGVGDVIRADDPAGPLSAERIGSVVDRGRMLNDGPALPARVATLDELLLVVRRDSVLRFDQALGFHLYGADLCLQARERGLAAVVLGALCHHNSRHIGLREGFHESAAVFARKWKHRLPIATPCVIIDRDGGVRLLGNASERPRSIAYAMHLPAAGADRGSREVVGDLPRRF
jgi:Glycosyltransferase like family